jgi:hypothetical protein
VSKGIRPASRGVGSPGDPVGGVPRGRGGRRVDLRGGWGQYISLGARKPRKNDQHGPNGPQVGLKAPKESRRQNPPAGTAGRPGPGGPIQARRARRRDPGALVRSRAAPPGLFFGLLTDFPPGVPRASPGSDAWPGAGHDENDDGA